MFFTAFHGFHCNLQCLTGIHFVDVFRVYLQ